MRLSHNILICILICNDLFASSVSPRIYLGSDSDHIRTAKYGIGLEILEDKLQVDFENTKIRTDFEIGNFNSVNFHYKFKSSDSVLIPYLGTTKLKFREANRYKQTYGLSYSSVNRADEWSWGGDVGHGPSYKVSSTRASIINFLSSDYAHMFLSKLFLNKHRISARPSINYYSTNNSKLRGDFDYMYGLITNEKHWLWAGIGGERFVNSKPSDLYWSPKNFFSTRTQLDYSYVLTSDSFFGLGLNLSRFKENNIWGNGIYLASSVQKKINNSHLKVAIEYINSQSNKNWNSLVFNFDYRFPL